MNHPTERNEDQRTQALLQTTAPTIETLEWELAQTRAECSHLEEIADQAEHDRLLAEAEREIALKKLRDHRRNVADWCFGSGYREVLARFDGPGAPAPFVDGRPGRHATPEFYRRLATAALAEADGLEIHRTTNAA